jgi:hypothetical protein
MDKIKNTAASLSSEERSEIANLTDTLSVLETELVPVDVDEISNLMQTSDDDILVQGRITEFHDLEQVLTKRDSGTNKTPSLAKSKQNRKNKQKLTKQSRKNNR